ncbi:MAG TPA: phytanoyl-CoA dioxygenase family protein [Polyangiaceae bacterium]|nr:phytanoyl-CoA dioxygenase family protein [Polyangiaceae bacterium]
MSSALSSRLSPAQRSAFDEAGYLVLADYLRLDELEVLRSESDAAVADAAARLERNGASQEGLSVLGQRYYVAGRSRGSSALRQLLLGRLGATCRDLLAPKAYLFTDVFVCKEPHQRVNACWHQDYSYLAYFYPGRFQPNISAWLALDDVDEENGALQVMPFSAGGPRVPVAHHLDRDWNGDDVVDFGSAPRQVLPVRAGTLVLMSGLLAHWSGPNRSTRRRRAYLVQYSPAPVVVDGEPIEQAVPVPG